MKKKKNFLEEENLNPEGSHNTLQKNIINLKNLITGQFCGKRTHKMPFINNLRKKKQYFISFLKVKLVRIAPKKVSRII
jgi:hypothetical protein